jgi:flavocytochrome c
MEQVIVIGGGMSGLAAAHTVLENGGRVVLVEKMAFCGGNSSKATSGINGAQTRTQRAKGIADSPETFEQDSIKGGAERPELVHVLTFESASGVEWLMDKFGLDLSLVSRLGGHSFPRTHRGKTKFPGMTITYALLEKYEDLCQANPDRCRLINKARVTRFLTDSRTGEVSGVEYTKDGKTLHENGAVIVATGGFGSDFAPDGLIKKYRPDLHHLPTTNGEFSTGDGIKLAEKIGADTVDLEWIQVHPTGLLNPSEPNSKTLFLGAEALRGVGGFILDGSGKRFCNELGRRDYVTGEIWKNKGPFRLVLNSKASKEIEWHCKHYKGRGLMKEFHSGEELAREMGIAPGVLESTFRDYNIVAEKQTKDPNGGPYDAYPSGKSWDKWGKKFYHNTPVEMNDSFHVAFITPVIHYCMGGLKIDTDSRVLSKKTGKPVGFLYGAGEICGGVHGKNRLGGSSLLDCIVFGRVSGRTATREMLEKNIDIIRKSKTGNSARA